MTHAIEIESYRILRAKIDLSDRPGNDRAVVERMIHATADQSFAHSTRIGSEAVAALTAAIAANAPVIVDAAMVAAGITRHPTTCYLPRVPEAPTGSTRSAAAIALAAQDHPRGAVFVIGNAPTALFELLRLCAAGVVEPAAVVGLPVGFVGAARSKAELWRSALAPIAITNEGELGGSPVAAAAVNVAVRLASAAGPRPVDPSVAR